MATSDPLAQLKDIHLPHPISWWPLAPGWYLLLSLIVLLSAVLAYYLYKKHVYAVAKKQALRLLTDYQRHYEKEHNIPQSCTQISELLRRVALVYYPRKEVASLYGEEWLHFLNKTSQGVDFNRVKDMLLIAPFKTHETQDLEPLFAAAHTWIKQRRVPCSN